MWSSPPDPHRHAALPLLPLQALPRRRIPRVCWSVRSSAKQSPKDTDARQIHSLLTLLFFLILSSSSVHLLHARLQLQREGAHAVLKLQESSAGGRGERFPPRGGQEGQLNVTRVWTKTEFNPVCFEAHSRTCLTKASHLFEWKLLLCPLPTMVLFGY